PGVTLNLSNPAKPTFSAPPAASPSGYTASFNLTVTNGGSGAGDSDTTVTPVSIAISASTPSATVSKARDGSQATYFTGDKITLSATTTTPDATAEADYTYLWSQASGVPTTLSSTTAAHPTYIIPTQTNGTSACTSGTTSATANCPRFQVVVTKTNTGKAS